MDRAYLNEHDANLGAQSKGEFLGMTGNSGWYLLGSAGASIVSVLLFWGVFRVSLLLCLLLGAALCALSVAYVFVLKNNRPEHYDTDFLEAMLIEAGLLQLTFGPRWRIATNPFACRQPEPSAPITAHRRTAPAVHASSTSRPTRGARAAARPPIKFRTESAGPGAKPNSEVAVVPLAAYEKLRDELAGAEALLDEAIAEREEE